MTEQLKTFDVAIESVTAVSVVGGHFFISYLDKVAGPTSIMIPGEFLPADVQEMLLKIYSESLH